MKRLGALVMTGAVASGWIVDGQVVFRSYADEVIVDVSVMRGKSPVTGLTPADFVLTDNGVRQSIRDISVNAADIDVTVVIQRDAVLSAVLTDTQGRFAGIRSEPADRSIDAASDRVRRLIQPSDGLRVLTADADVRPAGSARPTWGVPTLGRSASSILDGLTAAMMLKPTAVGRRQLIIGITGGTDDRSFVPALSRLNVALRTDAVVHIVALGQGREAFSLQGTFRSETAITQGVGVAGAPLRPIADATGGRLYQVEAGADVETMLKPAIEEFRTRYLLRYVPTGVERAGWHEIVVTVPAGSFTVRHRRGYEVGTRAPGT